MKIIYSKNYDKCLKELKKKHRNNELEVLNDILDIIKSSDNYNELKSNPLTYIYDFEELREDKSGFCSFKLSRSGGKTRLIVRPRDNTIVLEVVYISLDHYKDFNPKGVMLYDE